MKLAHLRSLGLVIAAGALLLAACDNSEASDDSPTSEPTGTGASGDPSPAPGATEVPDQPNDEPPAAVAVIDGEPHEMQLGTSCWGGLCRDAVGIIAPPQQVTVASGATLEMGGDITGVDLTETGWMIYPTGAEPDYSGEGWVAFTPNDQGIEIAEGEGAVLPDLEPGTYVLNLSVWRDGQDAHYGLWLNVR